eukprot:CAMPEP_0170299690 /NCGR_PEP_ID=MMETSP0116_2-20130129/50054_1 /TAXON_ID=400756 /ORGANISM="Durinskia baltica, Strain CSIRO CS-38" /LENGTH=293 /DNA_ID=CAMNT_0010551411 /DNA_START=102 /DNA_END=982 /DNA_ORIENTATION=+
MAAAGVRERPPRASRAAGDGECSASLMEEAAPAEAGDTVDCSEPSVSSLFAAASPAQRCSTRGAGGTPSRPPPRKLRRRERFGDRGAPTRGLDACPLHAERSQRADDALRPGQTRLQLRALFLTAELDAATGMRLDQQPRAAVATHQGGDCLDRAPGVRRNGVLSDLEADMEASGFAMAWCNAMYFRAGAKASAALAAAQSSRTTLGKAAADRNQRQLPAKRPNLSAPSSGVPPTRMQMASQSSSGRVAIPHTDERLAAIALPALRTGTMISISSPPQTPQQSAEGEEHNRLP